MSSNVVFACVAGPGLDSLTEAARLLMSLRWFGGSVAGARFVVGCTEPIPGEAVRLFRHYRADIVHIPFDSSSPDRISLLGSPALAGHEVVVMLDPRAIVIEDPTEWLGVSGVAARIIEAPRRQNSGNLAVTAVAEDRERPQGEEAHEWPDSGRAVDIGVVIIAGRHRISLATDWDQCRRALNSAPDAVFSQDGIDQVSFAMGLDKSGIVCRPLPEDRIIIQYNAVSAPSGFVQANGPGRSARHIEAFNSRLRASGHAALPAAADLDLQRMLAGSGGPKVVVASGWWCDRRPHDWTIGAISTRSVAFFDVWYRQVMHCLRPERIVVTDSASPIKPDYLSYARVQWIELDKNYGHANDIRVGAVQTRYSGFTRSVINGAMHALCCDADYYVYVEQDCLLYGEDFLARAVGLTSEDILLGPAVENGRGMAGNKAAQMLQQSLMVVGRSGLERFLEGVLGSPWSDGECPPEKIMRLRLAPFGFVQVPYGRSRPIDFGRSHFYAQHLTEDELAQFLARAGVELPQRSFPFRVGELETVRAEPGSCPG